MRKPKRRAAVWVLAAAVSVAVMTARPVLFSQESGSGHGGSEIGVMGDWTEPTGSVIHVGACGTEICLWVVVVSPRAPSSKDIYNPDPALRDRALCGLKIGGGFTARDAKHVSDGTLYDPKSGKTFRGRMAIEGSALRLRGYVGIPLFGQSETWMRPATPVRACTQNLGN